MDQSLASPWGSTIRKTTINSPQIVISKCLAVTADKPTKSTIKFFKTIGKRTMKAAPKKEPNIEPNPPMIIINNTGNEIAIISNDSVTSRAPKYTAKYKDPEIPM